MKNHHEKKSSKYLLWPLFVLFLLTIGVFFTTSQVPQQQDLRSRAQDFSIQEETPTPTVSPTPLQAVDVTVNIAFSILGTSTPESNTNPIHKTRNVIINFYDVDTNTQDREAVPLYSIVTTADYDTDQKSATYLKFVGRDINLKNICTTSGKCIQPGKYQIALKTVQSLQKVIKTNESDFSGKVYELSDRRVFSLNFGELILGDIFPVPNGDNVVDSEDVNTFTNCLGEKMSTPSCLNKTGADFDDNGIVNEADHTILLTSIQRIIDLGGFVSLPSPSVEPTKKLAVSPTLVPTSDNNAGASGWFLAGTIIVLLIAGTIIVLTNPKFKAARMKHIIEKKEFYIKKKSEDESGNGLWLTLADDTGTQLGHYGGLEVQEGFAHIRGEVKNTNGKKYIEVIDIMWDDQR